MGRAAQELEELEQSRVSIADEPSEKGDGFHSGLSRAAFVTFDLSPGILKTSTNYAGGKMGTKPDSLVIAKAKSEIGIFLKWPTVMGLLPGQRARVKR